jgi:hypothetical protein
VSRFWVLLADRRRLLLALMLVAFAAKAQEAACKAMLAGTRALVDATVHGLLDRELLRIVKLGVAGRLTVEASVVRKRQLWFGRIVSATSREIALTWSEERSSFELDGRPIRDPEHASLERITLPLGEAEDPGAYQVEVAIRLTVVTTGSLGRAADLLAAESDSALARTVLGAIANDLTRTANATCLVQPRR